MGLNSGLVAVGPFRRDIAAFLDYPESYYAETVAGSIVVVELFGVPTSEGSREFAALLGISDVWDFNQHAIDPAKPDLPAIRVLFSQFADGDRLRNDLERFERLRDAGFSFYFDPNG